MSYQLSELFVACLCLYVLLEQTLKLKLDTQRKYFF